MIVSPLPYLGSIRDYLKRHDPDAWNWFVENRDEEKQAEALRFDLLTATYRLDRENESEKDLYAAADELRERLGIEAPITFYQLQEQAEANAMMFSLPDETHLVFHGPIRANLTPPELKALLAHELAHHVLGTMESGEFRIARELLAALSYDTHYGDVYAASLRLFSLYSELFCDRVALETSGDLESVVSMFVKTQTGLAEVSAKSYLKQAEEIFSKAGALRSEGETHPEIYIRVRSLKLWSERESAASGDDVERTIARMIRPEPKLDDADLLERDRLQELTRRLVDVFLGPKELQTDLTLAHARLFFENYVPPTGVEAAALDPADFPGADPALGDYWCYVLLDFASADRDLEDAPLKKSFEIAARLELTDRFAEFVQKELKLGKRAVAKLMQ